eukprot:sb/3464987/
MDNGFPSPVDPSLELSDPNPNIHELFREFDKRFFWGKLAAVEVKWSPRMTLDRDGHGPEFHKHMYRINGRIGSKISVYHTFHDEVKAQKVHVWKCQGPCQHRPPFYGYVKRSMNRAPGPHDLWHAEHKANCGGTFVKVLEPPEYTKKKKKGGKQLDKSKDTKTEDKSLDKKKLSDPTKGTPKLTTIFEKSPPNSCPFRNFTPFSGAGNRLGGGPSSSQQPKLDLNQTKLNLTMISSSQSSVSSQGSVLSTISNTPSSSGGTKRRKKTPPKSGKKKAPPLPTSQITKYFVKKSPISDDDTDLLVLSPPAKRPKTKENEERCPVCDKLALLSSHLPICLSSIPDDEDELQIVREIPPPQRISPKEEGSSQVTSHDVMTSQNKVACPVCGQCQDVADAVSNPPSDTSADHLLYCGVVLLRIRYLPL